MGERMTPTQVAKEPGVRPHAVSLMYGLIKRGKIKSWPSESGRGVLVDKDEALTALSRMRHKAPRGESRRRASGSAPFKRGTLVSYGSKRTRVAAVTRAGGGEGTLSWTSDGHHDQFWQNESLAERVAKKNVNLENPITVLGTVAFHLREVGNVELADSLIAWAHENGLTIDWYESQLEAVAQIPEEEVEA